MEQSPSWEAKMSSASRYSSQFMEPECSLPHSQEPATCPHPEPYQSSPWAHPNSWIYIWALSFHLRLRLPSGFFPSGFPTKTLNAPLPSPTRVTCPFQQILLDFNTRITINTSLCSFLHSTVTSSLLGPNIFRSTIFSNTLSRHSSLTTYFLIHDNLTRIIYIIWNTHISNLKICISTALNLSTFSVATALHFINHTGDFPHSIFFFLLILYSQTYYWNGWMIYDYHATDLFLIRLTIIYKVITKTNMAAVLTSEVEATLTPSKVNSRSRKLKDFLQETSCTFSRVSYFVTRDTSLSPSPLSLSLSLPWITYRR